MPLPSKNTVSTSFTIDLSTIDRKMDKILRYFTNCNIDLRDDGLRFVNFEVDYKSLEQSLRNKKYKQSLSTAVDKIYTQRFINTRAILQQNSLIGTNDFLFPQPLDDFGSKFDAFAATNTDPNNAVLQVLGVDPYVFLKVDILSEEDLQTYNDSISAYYDVEKLSFVLQKLENLTSAYVGTLNESAKNYIDKLKIDVLDPKYKLQESVPSIQNALNLLEPLKSLFFDLKSDSYVYDTLSIVEPEIYSGLNQQPPLPYDYSTTEKAKIKILDFIIRNGILEALENKIATVQNLDSFRSEYDGYDFFEQKFVSSSGKNLSVRKENVYFRLTYYRQPPQLIFQQLENKTSDTKIEFNLISSLNIQNPFSDPSIKNNKFVAILSGADLSSGAPIEFFEPTILSILSDIDFISNNILEMDPFYCPTPESLQQTSLARREQYLQNEVFKENIEKSKYFVDSNNFAFNYKTFPDSYFIPNLLMGPDAFFERINQPSMSRDKSLEIIRKNSKYYYSSESETPAAAISRDQNMRKMFENAAMNNGFYGLYEIRKDSFADPALVQQIIGKIDNLGSNAVNEIQDIIFARTNIACLLSEFQACFLPKVGNCRDVLRGFRFAELEEIVKKAFPESAYPTLFESIKVYKSNAIKDQREKKLIEEIESLEKQLENNDRKKIVFDLLDQKIEPATALNRADTIQGLSADSTLKERYEQKLQEYKDLKENQEVIATAPLGTEPAFQEIDQFLDLLESNGIDVEILCDLARLITDLSQISFTFGTISLPELPSIDIFQETKLSIDLAVVELIFQTVVAFIRSILEELLTCNGVKDLIKAGLTGEAANLGMAATTAAALNQVARGNFDLENFVQNNPQVNPKEFKRGLNNIGSSLANSVTVQDTTAVVVNPGEGIFGGFSAAAVSTTSVVLTNPNSSAVTEQEIVVALTGLVSELSNVLDPLQFINLIGGKASSDDLIVVSSYIRENRPELSYLASTSTIKNIFNHISDISGLAQVRNDLLNVATTYSNLLVQSGKNKFCFDEVPPTDLSEIVDKTGGKPDKTPEEIETEKNRAKYRDLIKNLMKASPQQLKSIVDDQIFKPVLMGMLPSGKMNSAVDAGNKKRIKSSLKPIADKFKTTSNSFYSKLALKKQVERRIPRYLTVKDKDQNESQVDNPEYKNQVNMGGYPDGFDGDSITVKEDKYVYGGVFTENFTSGSMSLEPSLNGLKISLAGKKASSSKALQDLLGSVLTGTSNGESSENEWKIENIQNENENIIKIFEGKAEKFSYKIKLNESNNIEEILNSKQKFNKILKDSIYPSLNSPSADFDQNLENHLNDSYNNFMFSGYKNSAEKVLKDQLLVPIENVPVDDFFNSVSAGLSSSLGINLNTAPPPVGVQNPNIDTPLKYVNFCPKPTQQQKGVNKDPSLYGLIEIQALAGEILNKRNKELTNLKSLQEMLSQDDSNLELSLLDCLVFSLVRSYCADYLLRSLFVLRTLKFDNKIIEDLLLPTYISENMYSEIKYFSNIFKKSSFLSLTRQHIDYVHEHMFVEQMNSNSDPGMFADIKKIKNKLASLAEDRRILLLYKNRITPSQAYVVQSDFMEKIDNYIKCLKDEIKYNEEKLAKLQIRNIAYNEIVVMLDKLSYITSTNRKITDDLDPECKKDTEEPENDSGVSTLGEIYKSEMYDVYSFRKQESAYSFVVLQNKKYSSGNKIIFERYFFIPQIKNNYQASQIQSNFELYGIQSINNLKFLMNKIKTLSDNPSDLNDLFVSDIKYGIRAVYIADIKPPQQSLIDYDLNKSLYENFKNYINLGKNLFYLNDSQYQFKDNVNFLQKTYSIPYIQGVLPVQKIGAINVFPIVVEETKIDRHSVKKLSDFISLADYIIEDKKEVQTITVEVFGTIEDPISAEQVRLSKSLKNKVICNPSLLDFNQASTNEDLIPNFMILSSINILNSKEMQTPFGSLRFQIMKDMMTKTQSIYNKDNQEAYDEMIELMSSPDFFKLSNAEAIIKILIRAAIYVLQYYCQMTDPNISLATMIRNAVKIAFSAASQVGSSLGATSIPPELPPPLSLLAPYSMAQLPITVFGVPPAGIGVGPPLTIPGMVLLGAELLLLNLDFAENIDKNTQDQKIKDLLKKYCFDLEGYKKYGV